MFVVGLGWDGDVGMVVGGEWCGMEGPRWKDVCEGGREKGACWERYRREERTVCVSRY